MLEVDSMSVRFGGLRALEDVSLSVGEWEIVGLIGPNGAGKTTAFNCITGLRRPDGGRVRLGGRDVTNLPAHRRVALGMGRTFQNVGMVKSATALDNVRTAQHLLADYPAWAGIGGLPAARRSERTLTDRADTILELLGLADVRDLPIAGLPYGRLKLLELGCALATDPDLLLLDEPSSGMGPAESHELGRLLLAIRREFELTILLIEHHVPLVTEVCDYVYVLNFGRLLADGQPTQIRQHPEVVAAYLGDEASPAEPYAGDPVTERLPTADGTLP